MVVVRRSPAVVFRMGVFFFSPHESESWFCSSSTKYTTHQVVATAEYEMMKWDSRKKCTYKYPVPGETVSNYTGKTILVASFFHQQDWWFTWFVKREKKIRHVVSVRREFEMRGQNGRRTLHEITSRSLSKKLVECAFSTHENSQKNGNIGK